MFYLVRSDVCGNLLDVGIIEGDVLYSNTGPSEQITTIGKSIFLTVDDSLDACLDNQLGALDTRCVGDIDRCPGAVVGRCGHLSDGIGFCVQYIRFRHVVLILTDVLEPRRCPVITIGDDHIVFDDEGSDLEAFAVRVLRPYHRHTEIPFVQLKLLLFGGFAF